MTQKINTEFFFLISLLFLTNCIGEQKNYFPLNDGRVWNYDIKINPGIEEKINYKKTNYSLKKQFISKSGKKLKIQPIVRENNNIYYYSEDKNGILRQGIQLNGSNEINFEDEKKYVLKYPIKKGTERDSQSKTFLILRRYAYFDYRATTNFNLNYRVSSINEVVKVPAGKFKNCIKISGTGNTTFIGDREIGSIKINIRTIDWFAPNVGLIKSIRLEETDTELFGTSKMVQVLDDFR